MRPSDGADHLELLTPAEMSRADQLTIAGGTPGSVLMEAAGQAVAEAARALAAPQARIVVLAGPGNNGGDGFVAARGLAEGGYAVTIAEMVARTSLKGDAAAAAGLWSGPAVPLSPDAIAGADLVIDGLFGAGLDRDVSGVAAETIAAVNASGLPVVAIDLPSGVSGQTGQILGAAIAARASVTFFRLKPGHVLLPGRSLAGKVTVAQIGIEDTVLDAIHPRISLNRPGLWRLPSLQPDGHKYTRGHTVVVSGPATRTGAARLAARGALRVGSGLVTVASPLESLAANAAHLTAIMLLPMEGPEGLAGILVDERRNAVALGPALGIGTRTVGLVEAALRSSAAAVVDADGLMSFVRDAAKLFALIKAHSAPVVLTPHDGEFARLFPGAAALSSKVERARTAAAASGAVILLKGPDTVVAAPDGRAAIADNAPPVLATAGSGDVLAGMVAGLMAQGLDGFAAANAAVYLHGEAGRTGGRGLIAEDLPEALPAVFAELDGAGA